VERGDVTDDSSKKAPHTTSQREDDEENERPTLNPPFDVEAFARAAMVPAMSGPTPPSKPSAPAEVEIDVEVEEDPREEQDTLTNEVELEAARARSAQPNDPPAPMPDARSAPAGNLPRGRTVSAPLSLADALSPSSAPPEGGPSAPSSIEAAVLGAISSAPPPEITERTIEDPVAEMRERVSLGDYSGALEMAELILAEDPGHLEAAECGETCRAVLQKMYAARLGPLDRAPMIIVPRAQLRWLSIDHRAGFVLSLVDGASTLDMIIDVSGMPRLDVLRILHDLIQQRIIAFKS
jgi:hypothetical protein